MSKNIVLCCDGTNNQFAGHHTNVVRTYKVAERSARQVTFYDCGVGTMPEPWAKGKLGRCWSMLKGLAFGSGFMQNIEDAYRFLIANYEQGDKVYLFGFSRGAYTARALAGLLRSVGLIRPGTENLIPYALRYWQKDFRPLKPSLSRTEGQKLCEEFKSTLARPCPVHFIGAWDTVSSVGIINQFRTYPHTAHNPDVTHVRHAVAIDERRNCYRQNLMFRDKEQPEQAVKNVWFAGVHSDVGGGYPTAKAGLAKVTFEWMMREAGDCGMLIDPVALQHELRGVGALPDPCADQNESLNGLWWLVEFIPMRRFNAVTGEHEWRLTLGRRRNVLRYADRSEVRLHSSVLARLNARAGYHPSNLPHDDSTLCKTFHLEI